LDLFVLATARRIAVQLASSQQDNAFFAEAFICADAKKMEFLVWMRPFVARILAPITAPHLMEPGILGVLGLLVDLVILIDILNITNIRILIKILFMRILCLILFFIVDFDTCQVAFGLLELFRLVVNGQTSGCCLDFCDSFRTTLIAVNFCILEVRYNLPNRIGDLEPNLHYLGKS
jgi:hypothetical protein